MNDASSMQEYLQEYLEEADNLAGTGRRSRQPRARATSAAARCCRTGAICRAPSSSAGRRSKIMLAGGDGVERRQRRLRARTGAVVLRRSPGSARDAAVEPRPRARRRRPATLLGHLRDAVGRCFFCYLADASERSSATTPRASRPSARPARSPTRHGHTFDHLLVNTYEGALLLATGKQARRSTSWSARSARRGRTRSNGTFR